MQGSTPPTPHTRPAIILSPRHQSCPNRILMFEPLSAEYWEPVQRNRGYRQARGIFGYGGHLGGGGAASAKGSLTLSVPERQSLSAQSAAAERSRRKAFTRPRFAGMGPTQSAANGGPTQLLHHDQTRMNRVETRRLIVRIEFGNPPESSSQ